MIIKIGKKYFNSKVEPIMVELTPIEISYIKNMKPWERRLCTYPKEMSATDVRNFMCGVEDEELALKIEETIVESWFGPYRENDLPQWMVEVMRKILPETPIYFSKQLSAKKSDTGFIWLSILLSEVNV